MNWVILWDILGHILIIDTFMMVLDLKEGCQSKMYDATSRAKLLDLCDEI